MKKGLKTGIICGVLVTASVAGAALYYLKTSKGKPEETLNKYISLLNDKNYEGMYDLVSKDSNISKEDFITRNKNIYEGIGASNIEVEKGEIESNRGKATINYDSKLQTLAGEVDFSNKMELEKDNDGDYKIIWDSTLIFPELKDDYKVRVSTIKGKRGTIYDKNGTAIALDDSSSNVGIVPGKFQDKENEIASIASILQMSVKDINTKLNASYVTDDMFVPLKAIAKGDERELQLSEIPCVTIKSKDSRVYPLGEAAAHLTGYVQAINADELKEYADKNYNSTSIIGKAGLEKLYEDSLRCFDGAEVYITDSKEKKVSTLASREVKNGTDLNLTIDANLQQTIYTDIAQDKGAAVAMDPQTGAVLALVSTPSYNPNSFVMGMNDDEWNSLNNNPNKPLYNRFKATMAPGSTFKSITGVIALDTNSIDPNKSRGITGLAWQKDNSWGNYNVTRLKDYGKNSNLENAMVYSDNIYFAQVALDIGKDNFVSKLKSFGFDEDMNFEFGLTPSSFGSMDTEIHLADSGYGQAEIAVNPVHLASMYSMFVNEGSMVKPYLVNDGNSATMWKQNVVSKESANTMLNDMIQVVENPNGTGSSAAISGVTIAAKTGTAEIKQSQDDTTGTEIGWFAAITTNKENNIEIIEMVEDVKDRGGSHYVVPKVRNAIMQYN